MTLKDKFQFLIEYFEEHNPDAASELNYHNPFELLIAVILSAQCTDKRVNMVTPHLFKVYPTPEAMAQATVEEIFELISSISYPKSKSKYLSSSAKKLVENFNSTVPATMEELTTLSGVGRKTANVILSVIFNQAAMAVDTHVFRVSARLGIVKNAKTPEATEKQLMKHFPAEIVPKAHHWLILHGRYICLARKPMCEKCGLTSVCNYFQEQAKETNNVH